MSGSAFGGGSALSGGSCPCGSHRPYAECCGPLLAADRQAVTAAELMRSRYTAFARGDVAHLLRTWHPRTRPERLELDPSTRWTGLTVLRTERGGDSDDDGVVEFVARWTEPDGPGSSPVAGRQHEVSRFARRAGRWLYLDGDRS